MAYDSKGKKMKVGSEYKKSGKTSKPKTSDRKSKKNTRALNTFYKNNGSRSKSKSY